MIDDNTFNELKKWLTESVTALITYAEAATEKNKELTEQLNAQEEQRMLLEQRASSADNLGKMVSELNYRLCQLGDFSHQQFNQIEQLQATIERQNEKIACITDKLNEIANLNTANPEQPEILPENNTVTEETEEKKRFPSLFKKQ